MHPESLGADEKEPQLVGWQGRRRAGLGGWRHLQRHHQPLFEGLGTPRIPSACSELSTFLVKLFSTAKGTGRSWYRTALTWQNAGCTASDLCPKLGLLLCNGDPDTPF